MFIPLYPQSLHSAETGSVLGGKENRKLFSVLFLILILFQMLFHVYAGRHSVQILESGREIVGIGESGQVRHFGYGVPFLRQQFCRLFQSDVRIKSRVVWLVSSFSLRCKCTRLMPTSVVIISTVRFGLLRFSLMTA